MLPRPTSITSPKVCLETDHHRARLDVFAWPRTVNCCFQFEFYVFVFGWSIACIHLHTFLPWICAIIGSNCRRRSWVFSDVARGSTGEINTKAEITFLLFLQGMAPSQSIPSAIPKGLRFSGHTKVFPRKKKQGTSFAGYINQPQGLVFTHLDPTSSLKTYMFPEHTNTWKIEFPLGIPSRSVTVRPWK